MQKGVESVIQAEGKIDVLINNAGYGYFGAIENVPMEEARKQLEVNVCGLARLTQLVLPYMRKQRSGRIINTSSIAGKMVFYMGGWYNVTKYSVEALSDALRMEMKPFGIDVVMIEPGAIKTDWGIVGWDSIRANWHTMGQKHGLVLQDQLVVVAKSGYKSHLSGRQQPPTKSTLLPRPHLDYGKGFPCPIARPLVGRNHALGRED